MNFARNIPLNKLSCVILSLSFVFEAKALVMMIVVQVGIDSARDGACTDIDEARLVRHQRECH